MKRKDSGILDGMLLFFLLELLWLVIKGVFNLLFGGGITSVNEYSGYVYFITTESYKTIKIGYSKDVNLRINQLQTGCSETLVLVGYMPGDIETETRLHKYFHKYRIRDNGEWFVYCDDIKNFIAKNCTIV